MAAACRRHFGRTMRNVRNLPQRLPFSSEIHRCDPCVTPPQPRPRPRPLLLAATFSRKWFDRLPIPTKSKRGAATLTAAAAPPPPPSFATPSPPLQHATSVTTDHPPGRFVLIDGGALLGRSFGAASKGSLAELHNSYGEPTGALLAFLKSVRLILAGIPDATHLLVAMDSERSQLLRRASFPEYKASRPEATNDFLLFSDKARIACESFGWPFQSETGYEADDIIATYTAAILKNSESTVHIVSPDKDLLQLVQPRVWLHSKPTMMSEVFGEERVLEQWGVRPNQVADYLALVGDACDNLPGVPYVGPKRAVQLLSAHDNLDGVLNAAATNSLGPQMAAVTKKLVEFKEGALRSRDLISLKDVPSLLSPSASSSTFQKNWAARIEVPVVDEPWLLSALRFCYQESLQQLASELRSQHGHLLAPQHAADVTVVCDEEHGLEVMAQLRKFRDSSLFAVHLEMGGKSGAASSLVIHGEPHVDLGKGPSLWLDLLAEDTKHLLLPCFGEFFQDKGFRKVYHCFGQVRRALFPPPAPFVEEDRRLTGLASDTMHMARLLDPSLMDYSLEGLAAELLGRPSVTGPVISEQLPEQLAKEQTQSAERALAVLDLHFELRRRLAERPWLVLSEGPAAVPSPTGQTLLDMYEQHYCRFAVLLSDLEMVGFNVDRDRLWDFQRQVDLQLADLADAFRGWVARRLEAQYGKAVLQDSNLVFLNLSSSRQLAHLLFGTGPEEFKILAATATATGTTTVAAAMGTGSGDESLSEADEIEEAAEANLLDSLPSFDPSELQKLTIPVLKGMCQEHGLLVTGTKQILIARLSAPQLSDFRKKRSSRKQVLRLPGLGLTPLQEFRSKKLRQLQITRESLVACIKHRADELGTDGVEALSVLLQWREREKCRQLLEPLDQASAISGRVHAHLNLNTETGRLSSRSPNLQQQPTGMSLPIRQAFAAPVGHKYIVADYSQLELRVVAHIAQSKPMIDILISGGDIHSSTAYKMFEEVQQAVDGGRVLLDATNHNSEGASLPLVKDVFPELRKKAKVLNFSLLYGKTSYGLTKDWGVDLGEAQLMIDKWFAAFPEIRDWIRDVEKNARCGSFPLTVMGRTRPLKAAMHKRQRVWEGALRQVVNSPIQGSAADIVTLAMLQLDGDPRLRALGFRQILQIHDEIVLEGPEDLAEEALERVLTLMENPLPFDFSVPLKVDARITRSWGE